jgi:hypothetical protein
VLLAFSYMLLLLRRYVRMLAVMSMEPNMNCYHNMCRSRYAILIVYM